VLAPNLGELVDGRSIAHDAPDRSLAAGVNDLGFAVQAAIDRLVASGEIMREKADGAGRYDGYRARACVAITTSSTSPPTRGRLLRDPASL
jgi:hypothetical protein